jgi:PP-loop family
LVGKACRDRKIERLFLGHHSDDQYETAIARIAKNASYSLGAIDRLKNIPENEGVYGVHESGHPVDFNTDRDARHIGTRGFESGGIKVTRPLIGYSKAELVQICQQNGVPWIEDPSNSDKALTIRNAIRHGLSGDLLPQALRKQAVLDLVTRNDATLQMHQDLMEILFELCVVRFDPLLGQVFVRIPRQGIRQCTIQSQNSPTSVDILLTVSLLIRRLIQMVSPNEHVNLAKVAEIAETWIQLSNPAPGKPSAKEFHFQAGGVQIANFLDPDIYLPYREGRSSSNVNFRRTDTVVFFRHQESKPRISEEGLARLKASVPLLLHVPPSFGSSQAPTKLHNSDANGNSAMHTSSQFQLYDNRFWISVHNPFRHPLRIRPLRHTDFDILASRFSNRQIDFESHCTQLKDQSSDSPTNHWTHLTAPPRKRRPADAARILSRALGVSQQALLQTIVPIIEYVDPAPQSSQQQGISSTSSHILGFPTLGVRILPGPEHGRFRWNRAGTAGELYRLPKGVQDLSWVVRYKHINFGTHAEKLVEEVLVLPVDGENRERSWRFDLGGRCTEDRGSYRYVKEVDEKLERFRDSHKS